MNTEEILNKINTNIREGVYEPEPEFFLEELEEVPVGAGGYFVLKGKEGADVFKRVDADNWEITEGISLHDL